MGVYDMTETKYEVVYDALSFTLACMASTTLFLWFRVSAIKEELKTALLISGMVTAIATYHYVRIFNSWTGAYTFNPTPSKTVDGYYEIAPTISGVPFNDAYRYMDWLLTVPLLLMEIVLVMKLDSKTAFWKCVTLGCSSAAMIILGYPGEIILASSELHVRWIFWALAMCPFLYVVYELTMGLKQALDKEDDAGIKSKIWWAQRVTIVSWLTYPIVYIIPMLGAKGANAVVGIQMGYCFSDIVSKCGVGLLIYQITLAKSRAIKRRSPYETAGASETDPLLPRKQLA